ncbi:hypothetical protein HK101_004602 [Irineochytrium annulatum]|nr:hypothetical protein HK101_004602 [Irineochytrium annulatum]
MLASDPPIGGGVRAGEGDGVRGYKIDSARGTVRLRLRLSDEEEKLGRPNMEAVAAAAAAGGWLVAGAAGADNGAGSVGCGSGCAKGTEKEGTADRLRSAAQTVAQRAVSVSASEPESSSKREPRGVVVAAVVAGGRSERSAS